MNGNYLSNETIASNSRFSQTFCDINEENTEKLKTGICFD